MHVLITESPSRSNENKNSKSTGKAYFLKLGYTLTLTFIAMVLYRIS